MDALEEYVNDKYPGVPLLSPEEYKARKSVPVNTSEYYVRDVSTSTGVKYQLMKSFPNSNDDGTTCFGVINGCRAFFKLIILIESSHATTA